jgi:hypothetical protein
MAEACRIVKGEYPKKLPGRTCTLEMGTRVERANAGRRAELRLVGEAANKRSNPRAAARDDGAGAAMRARIPRAHHQPPLAELAPCIGMPRIMILPGPDAWPETSNRPASPPRSSSIVIPQPSCPAPAHLTGRAAPSSHGCTRCIEAQSMQPLDHEATAARARVDAVGL